MKKSDLIEVHGVHFNNNNGAWYHWFLLDISLFRDVNYNIYNKKDFYLTPRAYGMTTVECRKSFKNYLKVMAKDLPNTCFNNTTNARKLLTAYLSVDKQLANNKVSHLII